MVLNPYQRVKPHHEWCKSIAVTWIFTIQIVNLIRRIIMFGYTIVNRRYSEAVEFAAVNVLQGRCIVRFTNGYEYLYKNVKRTKLINLLVNKNMSLGFWIQELSNNAIVENRYRPQTGAMTYQQIGTSYKASDLPDYLAIQRVAV